MRSFIVILGRAGDPLRSGWRTDVLTGHYISGSDPEPAIAGERTNGVSDAAAEERSSTRAFLLGWNSDQAKPAASDQAEPEGAERG